MHEWRRQVQTIVDAIDESIANRDDEAESPSYVMRREPHSRAFFPEFRSAQSSNSLA